MTYRPLIPRDPPDEKLYYEIFVETDVDCDGTVNVSELQAALEKKGCNYTSTILLRAISFILNKEVDTIEKEEFPRVFYICETADVNELQQLLFMAADDDFSYSIDKEEMLKILIQLGFEILEEEIDFIYDALQDEEGGLSFGMFKKVLNELYD
ncbi:Calmodulin [Spironucleus salmonicida]|uniref:Calmodulin n=1 Tax=Spironucleus salmonicida TaxID=348837 RepID=V6LP24_9EUKA|nr:Calmodulin [Spironucleus salmonicida]|eukprot:EST46427.1 Calmodulin [Spironucleus salmonicida]